MRNLSLKKILDSPTYSTWLSLFSKYFTFLVITPLLLVKLDVNEIAIWYLFQTIVAFAGMLDLGFAQTLVRYSSYLKAGASNLDELLHFKSQDSIEIDSEAGVDIDWQFFKEVVFVFDRIYLLLSGISFFVLSILITILIRSAIYQSDQAVDFSIAWLMTIIGICVSLNGKRYDSVLRGMNLIPLINQWDIFFNLLLAVLYVLILFFQPRLVFLVGALQIISIITPLQKKLLMDKQIPQLRKRVNEVYSFNRDIFAVCWQPTWKTGIMMSGTQGVNHLSGIILANYVSPAILASYLFSQRILLVCNQFSWAPFYSRIPLFNELRLQRRIEKLRKITLSNINKSLYVLILLTFFVGILIGKALTFINANASFVSPFLWFLMVSSIFIDRVQAMHSQVYMTTNDIKFYKTSLISGAIYLVLLQALLVSIGEYAIPIAFIISNLSVNVWFNIKHSLRSLEMTGANYWGGFLFKPVLLFIILSSFSLLLTYGGK